MWPADRLFDKMKNLVEQPLQKAPEMQNVSSMKTLRVISCQTFEKELLWMVSFHHQSFIVRHHLALEGQVVPGSHSQGGKHDENQRRTWDCIGIIYRSCLYSGPPNRKPGWTSILLLDCVQGACPLYQQSPNLGRGSFFYTLHLRSTLEMVSKKEGPLDSDTFSGIL